MGRRLSVSRLSSNTASQTILSGSSAAPGYAACARQPGVAGRQQGSSRSMRAVQLLLISFDGTAVSRPSVSST